MNDEKELDSKTSDDASPIRLKAFSAEYVEKKHKKYVDMLDSAVQDHEIRNIALSGPYGVGKSSILQGFKERHPDAIFISLSTLGSRKQEKGSENDSSVEGVVSEETNQIQKEIVKQLLYRVAPDKLPVSRFKRVHTMSCWSRLGISCSIALLLTLLVIGIGALARIPVVIQDSPWRDFTVKTAVVFIVLSLLALDFSKLFEGRVHLEKITAGPAAIALSHSSDTYFDEYLDEIMYFFEITQKKIVVFEDIDRFDNSEIFEELRELNTLLNNAEYLHRKNRRVFIGQTRGETEDHKSIVFIYAMKDSILETYSRGVTGTGDERGSSPDDKADREAERANRTKFFDVIIPVVPFVTHQNARGFMLEELKGVVPEVSRKLVNETAMYLPDFRTIRSVCNEYRVYAEQLLNQSSLGLEADRLFAMMLYKAVHMRDFEAIRLGRSDLDRVYRTFSRIVSNKIISLNKKYDESKRRITAEEEAKRRGELFHRMIEWLSQILEHSPDTISLEIDQTSFDLPQIEDREFCEAILKMSNHDKLEIKFFSYSYGANTFSLTKETLAEYVGKDSVVVSLEDKAEESLNGELERISDERERYRSMNMSDLMSDNSAKVSETENEGGIVFSEYVEQTLGSRLAAMLVRKGYINENFVLYTSIYDEISLTANAMNFKIQHIDREIMNANYQLDDEEMKALISDVSIDELSRQGGYNISILDYLFRAKEHGDLLEAIKKSLIQDGEVEREFLQSFFSLEGEEGGEHLARLLAPQYPGIFDLLISLQGVTAERQRDYVDVTLGAASLDTNYDLGSFKNFVERSYPELKMFTRRSDEERQEVIVDLMRRSGAEVDDLSQIEEELRGKLIRDNCYVINRSNLEIAAENDDISLNKLKKEHPGVYSNVLDKLSDYLKVVEQSSGEVAALVDALGADEVIKDITELSQDKTVSDNDKSAGRAPSQLDRILRATSGKWGIDLGSVPNESWPSLVQFGRVKVTTENLIRYSEEYNMDDLTELLSKQDSITKADNLTEDDYVILVNLLLTVDEEQISLEQRIKLLSSIDYDTPVPVAKIESMDGELIGHLMKAQIVADDVNTYEFAKTLDWRDRELIIASSDKFIEYLEPDLLDGDANRIIDSEKISDDIKHIIVQNMNSYYAGIPEKLKRRAPMHSNMKKSN